MRAEVHDALLDAGYAEAALDWSDRSQIGRRNLSPEDFRIISGRIYNRRKRQHGGDRKSNPQNEVLKTAETIAAELGVSRASIERNAKPPESPSGTLPVFTFPPEA